MHEKHSNLISNTQCSIKEIYTFIFIGKQCKGKYKSVAAFMAPVYIDITEF